MNILRKGREEKRRDIDPETGRITLMIASDQGRVEDLETGLTFESAVTETWSIDPTDPSSPEVHIDWTRGLGRGEWWVDTHATTIMRGSRDHYDISQRLETRENAQSIFSKAWDHRVRR